IAFSGSLEARQDENGAAVRFATRDGQTALLYEGLMAVDASGDPVESTLAIIPGALRISLRDQGHPYPIVVDPTLVVPSWTAYGDQFDERFGASVAGAGDVNGDGFADVLVGAYQYDNGEFDEGAAFLYYGSTTGPSPLPAWTFEPNQTGAWFGYSVASAGDVNGDGFADIIVGAPLYDFGGFFDEGRVFVYFGSASGPSLNPSWTADGNKGVAHFGQSVAGAGDVNADGFADIVIGAPTYDTGRVFVFHGSVAGPSLSPDFMAKNGRTQADLGTSVAGVGDVNGDGFSDVAVGAPRIGTSTNPAEGSVLVYYGGRNGLANQPG